MNEDNANTYRIFGFLCLLCWSTAEASNEPELPLKTFKGYEYYFHASSPWKDWDDSKRFCNQFGMHLAVIMDEETNMYLHSYINNNLLKIVDSNSRANRDFWLASRKPLLQREWKWENSSSIISYKTWKQGFEPQSVNEQCLEMRQIGSVYSWYGSPCNFEQRFICQRKTENSIESKILINIKQIKTSITEMEDLKFAFNFNYSISICNIETPAGEMFDLNQTAQNQRGEIAYYGDGYLGGDCGILIKNISSNQAGLYNFSMKFENINESFQTSLDVQVNDSIKNSGLVVSQTQNIFELIETTTVGEHEDFTFSLKLNGTLEDCKATSPGGYIVELRNNKNDTRISSDGIDFSNNYCGFTLKNVDKSQSGNYICNMSFQSDSDLKIIHITIKLNIIETVQVDVAEQVSSESPPLLIKNLTFTQENGSLFFTLMVLSILTMFTMIIIFIITYKRMQRQYSNFRSNYCNILQKMDTHEDD